MTLQLDGNAPIAGSPSTMNAVNRSDPKVICEWIGFDAPSYGQPAKAVITINDLQASDDDSISLSPQWQKFASAQLSPRGIEVDFTPSGNELWKIIKKPAGMTDSEAEQIINDLFVHKYEGPWVFTVTNQP